MTIFAAQETGAQRLCFLNSAFLEALEDSKIKNGIHPRGRGENNTLIYSGFGGSSQGLYHSAQKWQSRVNPSTSDFYSSALPTSPERAKMGKRYRNPHTNLHYNPLHLSWIDQCANPSGTALMRNHYHYSHTTASGHQMPQFQPLSILG